LNLTVFSVNHELSGPILLDTFFGSVDSFLLSRKSFSRLAFPLYRPSAVGAIDMNRFRSHIRLYAFITQRHFGRAAVLSISDSVGRRWQPASVEPESAALA
jgi:hypothetical protein